MTNSIEKAKQIIKNNGGIIRTARAIKAGIHPRTLYKMHISGDLQRLSWGVYRLTDCEAISEPDLVVVATRIPKAVICLISALSFHDLTTQIPHSIAIALPKSQKAPLFDYPPIQVHKFSNSAYSSGIEKHLIDGVSVKIYCVEKTIADCFKFRNKIGMDIVLEALKTYRKRNVFNHKKLLEYGKICRVSKVMKPYLEASL